MDVERCIALHNEIIQHGWIGSGRSPDQLAANCTNWVDYYGASTEAVRPRLGPDLLLFLERAWFPNVKEFSFFYWVNSLAGPEYMFSFGELFAAHGHAADAEDSEEWVERFVVLYVMNDFGSHRLGLVYDQKTHLGIISPTIWEIDAIFNGRMAWHSLETILKAWLEMIRKEDVVAVPKNGGRYCPEWKYDPWVLVPYSDVVLEETIDAFNKLVLAIETRLPIASAMNTDDIVHGLVDENVLQSIIPSQRFAYNFLQRARRPQFQYIAPGLQVPTSSTISLKPFRLPVDDGSGEGTPILLFPSKDNYIDSCNTFTTGGEDAPFPWPFNQLSTYPTGMYLLSSSSSSTTEDEFRLILPFGIGSNGYARKSDGSRFGENRGSEDVEAKDRFTDLYRPGYQPFSESHEQRLVRVLKSWHGMVERGDWKIDQNGVAGGLDVWRDADTELHWEKYVVSLLQEEDGLQF